MLWQMLVIVYVAGVLNGLHTMWKALHHPFQRIQRNLFIHQYGKVIDYICLTSAFIYVSVLWPVHWAVCIKKRFN